MRMEHKETDVNLALQDPPNIAQLDESFVVTLEDGATTTVHLARFAIESTHPRVVMFDHETSLLQWCNRQNVANAMVGGFFLRDGHKPLGDTWIGGKEIDTVPFIDPWDKTRGSMAIDDGGGLQISSRYMLPQVPSGDLLQAGPLLLQNGKTMVKQGVDPEGFSAGASQFDSDITSERHPRAAIGASDEHIWSVVCDGRTEKDAGLFLHEFAQVLANLGIKDALNVDGGSSATLIKDGKLLNHPVGKYESFPWGRPVFSAIVFDEI
jgi:hypothetical protein